MVPYLEGNSRRYVEKFVALLPRIVDTVII